MEAFAFQQVKRVNETEALSSTVVLRMDGMLDCDLEMKPAKYWDEKV